MLSFGAVGQDVKDMQAALNQHPPTVLALLAEDGIFGSGSLARVREFQGNNNLAVDGIVGPNTWDKLLTTAPAEIAERVDIDCGTFAPGQRLLIHELCHVWQSQHHSNQFKFMSNAVTCQAKAVADNTIERFVDPDVKKHKDHPVQFPFSAYAYKTGLTLNKLAAEQMANAVEHGEAGVVAHVKSKAINVIDSDNVTALNLNVVGDRRHAGIKF